MIYATAAGISMKVAFVARFMAFIQSNLLKLLIKK